MNWEKARIYLVERAKEASTWRGLCLMLTAFGVVINPEQIEVICATGLFIAGVLGAATSDSGK